MIIKHTALKIAKQQQQQRYKKSISPAKRSQSKEKFLSTQEGSAKKP